MYKPNKRTLASIAAIAAVSAPSTASARFNLEGSYTPPAPPVVSAPVIQHPSTPDRGTELDGLVERDSSGTTPRSAQPGCSC